ncbi:hypothetical protein [Marinobacter daepoensis]|uniref:hypothetical protein n=1 Tax=Marinobacter daepoensis TaxID=262077 RepID=UPI0003FCB95D|nr:hypothetical protein [Marinobacter daepoensis]
MDDKPNYEIREKLNRKPPGEPLTIEEIRELKKIEAERVNSILARGVRSEDKSTVWEQLWSEGRWLPPNRRRPLVYVTGLTALNIPNEDGDAPGWHSHQLANRERWTWSGSKIESTVHLLKREGIYDATEILRRYAPETPEGTLAANWDRAVFDLLHHFSKIGEPVPNVQYKDLEHAINADQVKKWIASVDLPEAKKRTMHLWFKDEDS